MAVTSNRTVRIQFTGDVEYTQDFDAAQSVVGTGQNQVYNLSSGNNAIVVPASAVAATIIPASDNSVVLTLKGVNGDTGILLALTSPTSIGLDGSGTDFVLNAASSVNVRIIFS
jgi:hypothetical protein